MLLAAALRPGSVGRNAGKGGGAGSICVEGIAYTADGLGGAVGDFAPPTGVFPPSIQEPSI